MTRRVRIIGTGSFLPPFEVDNKTICKHYARRNAEWVEEKLGILTRRFAFDFEQNRMRPGYHDGEMALAAAHRALEAAGIQGKDLDLIVRVTCTADYLYFPDSACVLHEQVGAGRDCAAFTLPSGCGGFVYALKAAVGQMQGDESLSRVLVVASNSVSPFMDVQNQISLDWCRKNAFDAYVFGDGAGAVVLECRDVAAEEEGEKKQETGILAGYWGAWHERDPISYPAGGGANPTRAENVADHFYNMDLHAVAEKAPEHLFQAIAGIKGKYKDEYDRELTLSEIDWFLFHQANMKLLDGFAERAEIPGERVLKNGYKYGNTSAASVAILLDEAVRDGKIRPGNLLLLAAIGAGWQYGALLVRW